MTQILVVIIVLAVAMYIFYKAKVIRTKAPAEKRWQQMKATMALGTFVTAFGLNLALTPRSTLELIIGLVFILLGGANVLLGYKGYKHYLPFVEQEAEEARMKA
ncbi:YtpI family protein [Thalassorhabdus alkalitolerans]|uniref:YtpI family protein n=1 Tax=Thalassorhabdus alkalitolerans TaxID=2282697 RepID=A0ABW0YK02_9BACI|nr:YtpI family protein [Thalassobacillus sp. C254]